MAGFPQNRAEVPRGHPGRLSRSERELDPPSLGTDQYPRRARRPPASPLLNNHSRSEAHFQHPVIWRDFKKVGDPGAAIDVHAGHDDAPNLPRVPWGRPNARIRMFRIRLIDRSLSDPACRTPVYAAISPIAVIGNSVLGEAPTPPGHFLWNEPDGVFLSSWNQKEVSRATLYLMEILIRHFDFYPSCFLGLTRRAKMPGHHSIENSLPISLLRMFDETRSGPINSG
jgi:hypothetical protein